MVKVEAEEDSDIDKDGEKRNRAKIYFMNSKIMHNFIGPDIIPFNLIYIYFAD